MVDSGNGEECDLDNLNGNSCQGLGFVGGVLACGADCRYILENCSSVCGNGLLETGENCDDGNFLDFDGCSAGCVTEDGWTCTNTEPSTCSPICQDGIAVDSESCDMEDLRGQTCENLGYYGGELACTTSCQLDVTACEEVGRCGDNILQGAFEACEGSHLDGQICQDLGFGGGVLGCTSDCRFETAQCAGGCAGAIPISVPYSIQGDDFTVDFPFNTFFFTDASCNTGFPGRGVEMILAVDLVADETIFVIQGGGLDAQLFIQSTCDENGVCAEAVNDFGAGGSEMILFSASLTGTYFIIVKAYEASPALSPYTLHVGHLETPAELTCDDTLDNDFDGLADCADPDCFGLAGVCNVESDCGDFQDNDNDSFTDCFDSDCTGVAPCGNENTVDRCTDGLDNDADGSIDCSDPNCSGFLVCEPGQSCHSPLQITSFPFQLSGADFRNDFSDNFDFDIAANGCTWGSGAEFVFSVDLQSGERILMQETGSMDACIRVLEVCDGLNPTCLASRSECSNLGFTAPTDGTYYLVLEAASSTPYSNEYGYTFTVSRIDSIETACSDSLDNDFDGATDCGDPDCFSADCELGESCANPYVVTTFPFNINGSNFFVDYTNNHDFIWDLSNCGSSTGQPDAVFAINLLAGERILLEETGTIEYMIRVTQTCGQPNPNCLLSEIYFDFSPSMFFTAPVDGTFFITLESLYTSSTFSDYNFTIYRLDDTETSCIDEFDNDHDGMLDCADDDCSGRTPCGPENSDSYCSDFLDNDGDGLKDCADPECYGRMNCPAVIYSQNFDVWPLTGWTIIDGGTPFYTWFNSANMASTKIRTLNGSSGTFAVVDDSAAPGGSTFLDDLISPAVNCSGYTLVVLAFTHYFKSFLDDTTQVDISTDGGTSWQNVISYSSDTSNSVSEYLDVSSTAAGRPDVRIRFRYTSSIGNYWLIDNFNILAN